MDNVYRKIGIGNDAKNSMFFAVGSRFRNFIISDIILRDDEFFIYVEKDNEKQEWKTINKSIVTFKEKFLIE